MISSNQYQDIEIQQSSDFENVITFDSTHTMNANKQFVGKIQKDFANSTFTGPQKTGTVGTQANNDTWAVNSTITEVQFDLIADITGNTVTLTLPAEATQHFIDGFEGVWELLEKDVTTTANPIYTRQIQGDVVISNSAIQVDGTGADIWKAAA